MSATTDQGYVIAVTGLNAEARVTERCQRVQAVVGGGDAARLESLLERAISSECRGIASFGLAAGLWPGLRAGALIVGHDVADASTRYPTDAVWTARLQSRLPGARIARIAGVSEPLTTGTQKRALYAATGAAAADMESHVAARVAARHGLPVAAVRVIADPQDRDVPQAALAGLRSDGTTDTAAVLRALIKDPAQTIALVRVAADAGRAFAALLRCHRRLGPGLGLFDLG